MRPLVLTIIIATALVGGLVAAQLASDRGDRSFIAEPVPPPDDGEMYWGAFNPQAPQRGVAEALAGKAGEVPAIIMWFEAWQGEPAFPVEDAERLADLGIVPMVTWEPWDPEPGVLDPEDARARADQPDYRLDRIVGGDWDHYIAEYAAGIAEYGGPLFLRPFHEMDGFWYPWSGTANDNEPEDFVRAWRHMHGIFEDQGAPNVTWVWNVNSESLPDEPQNDMDRYWPGEEYVDWIGVTVYNYGETRHHTFTSFAEIAGERLERLDADYDAPIVITEFSSVEGGGDKAGWITRTFTDLTEQFGVAAAVWLDEAKEEEEGEIFDWRIDSSQAARDAFRQAVGAEHVLGAAAAAEAARTRRSD